MVKNANLWTKFFHIIYDQLFKKITRFIDVKIHQKKWKLITSTLNKSCQTVFGPAFRLFYQQGLWRGADFQGIVRLVKELWWS